MAGTTKADSAAAVETATREIGRYLWEHLERRTPTLFDRRWWDDQILSWAMSEQSVKVQMFRFVDVLPMLRTHEQVMRHLQEYFDEVRQHLPSAVRIAMDLSPPNSVLSRAIAWNARQMSRNMARRFIAGENVEEVLRSVSKLRKQGFAFTLDLLGEAVVSEPEADAYQQAYVELIDGLCPQINDWPEASQIDCDEQGPIPRVNVSIKLSALFSQFKPIDPAGTADGVKARLRSLLRSARRQDAFVNIDMEHHAYKDLTLEIFNEACFGQPVLVFLFGIGTAPV